MDLTRLRREVSEAQQQFSYVECHPTSDGSLYVLAALQTPAKMYTLSVTFPDTYPNVLPTVSVRKPTIQTNSPHRYTAGHICYLHPSMWNPGRHTLTFVIARAAKWLNKYEVWLSTGVWPGAEMKH
jgi:ubiquitin-protein ligase